MSSPAHFAEVSFTSGWKGEQFARPHVSSPSVSTQRQEGKFKTPKTMWKEQDADKRGARHVSRGFYACQSPNRLLQNCYFWPSRARGGGTARGAVTLPFIFFSIALIFSQQVCMSFILGKKRNFHFEKITVRPPKTEAGRTSLGQGNALRL